MRIPTRLAVGPTTWEREVDVVIIGSGVAGLMVALGLADVGKVALVTKGALDAGSTSWAQGGIAAAVDIADTAEEHFEDTMTAGVGLCSANAVRILVEEGPKQLANLVALGTQFDTEADGSLALGREGGHGRARIAHAGGDATGAEVQRALMNALEKAKSIDVIEDAFALDAVLDIDVHGSRISGVVVSRTTPDGSESLGVIHARAVVLASGGIGQVYASTTNPKVATGDGIALALRAGASVADMEFVQFHPTVLWQGPDAIGQQILISEAVRGEGAVLIDATGARVLEGVHPLGDLAPRDVVAKAMSIRMSEAPGGVHDHLFLDATSLGETTWAQRFPNILARCNALGINPVYEPIPVAPGEHFLCGGVRTDYYGHTDVTGLYAVGETADTGVHGANRLASNSLLEGLVFGDRLAWELRTSGLETQAVIPAKTVIPAQAGIHSGVVLAKEHMRIADSMSQYVGIRRTDESLQTASQVLDGCEISDNPNSVTRADWEATNVHLVAQAIVGSAETRQESRGCHWRVDHPESSDAYLHRTTCSLGDDGKLKFGQVDLEATP